MKLTRWITRFVFSTLTLTLLAVGSQQFLSNQAGNSSQQHTNVLADDGGTKVKPGG